MQSCVFKYCKICSQKHKEEDGISFHKMPADEVVRDKWICIIRHNRQQYNWQPSKFCVVCSLHFKDEDVYFTDKGRRLIKKTSIPTINISSPDISSSIDDINNPISYEIQSGPSNSLEENKIFIKVEKNDTSSEFSDSDLASIYESPKKHRLRKNFNKIKLLHASANRKVKLLHQKIRRLERRNASFKKIFKDLKDKNFINDDTHKLLNQNVIATELFQKLYLKKRSHRKITHSPDMKKFCMTLNSYSPLAYKYVRKTFNNCLPHPKTLACYLRMKNDPGLTQEALTPEVLTQEIGTPEMLTPEVITRELVTPEMLIPEVITQEIKTESIK